MEEKGAHVSPLSNAKGGSPNFRGGGRPRKLWLILPGVGDTCWSRDMLR